jgi:hypothetical protein
MMKENSWDHFCPIWRLARGKFQGSVQGHTPAWPRDSPSIPSAIIFAKSNGFKSSPSVQFHLKACGLNEQSC